MTQTTHGLTRHQWIATFVVLVCLALGAAYWQLQPILHQAVNPITPTPLPAASKNIIVTEPIAYDRVNQSFRVIGKARVFENTLLVRVSNAITGKAYVFQQIMTNAREAGTFGDFSYQVNLTNDTALRSGEELLIEVFQTSAKDGKEIDKVTIPVTFTPLLP